MVRGSEPQLQVGKNMFHYSALWVITPTRSITEVLASSHNDVYYIRINWFNVQTYCQAWRRPNVSI